jgi:hypothetical protein
MQDHKPIFAHDGNLRLFLAVLLALAKQIV